MADNLHNTIFSDTECISMDIMEKYATASLPPIEQQAVENHLVDCAICSDALEGLTLAGFSTDVEDRIASLNNRIASATSEGKAGFWKNRYTSYAAAVIGIMIVSGLLLNYLKTSDLAQSEFISEDVVLETPPPPAKQDIPLSDAENSTAVIVEEKLDKLSSGEITGSAVEDALDQDEDRVPAEEMERWRNQEVLKETQIVVSDGWSDQNQADLSTVESTDGQAEFQSGFTSLDEEEGDFAENKEADNRRRYEGENEGRKKAKAVTSENKPSDGKDLTGGGLKFAESEKAAGDADEVNTGSDFYYRSDRTSDESKAEPKLVEPARTANAVQSGEEEETEWALGKSTVAGASSSKAKEQTVVSREITAQEKSRQDKDKKKNYKSKSEDYDSDDFAFQTTESDRLTAQKGDAVSGKKEEEAAKESAEEYDNPNTKYDNAESTASELEPARQTTPEYNDPNTLYNAIKPAATEPESESLSSVSGTITSTNETKSLAANVTTANPSSDIADATLLPEQAPMFQGGEVNLRQYLADNMIYPDSAIQLGIDCKVKVSFTVNTDSTISDAIVLTPIGGGCDEEALRLINKMPNWVPAQQKGRKVKAQYNLELDFESIK